MSRLVQITVTTPTGTLWAQRYGFNAAGERICTLAGTTGTIGDAYNLDATGQLTGVKYGATGADSGYAMATNPTSTATWSYDGVGNRITQVDGAGTTAYTANAVNQYTAVTGAGTLAYSSRGDLIQQGDWSYVHDAGGNLIRAHNSQTNLLAKYRRDAAGHRAVKEGNSAKTLFFNFGFWPLEAYDTTAETARSTVYEPGIDRPLAEINNDGTIRFFYHQDWLGNIAMLTDAAGAKLQTYTYDAWGEPSGFDVSGNPIAASAFESRFLFTAREFDPETGLYHYRARAYSPAFGRFAQFDPIDFAAGDPNLLRYVDNQPSFLVDPLGLLTGGGGFRTRENWDDGKKSTLIPDSVKDLVDKLQDESNGKRCIDGIKIDGHGGMIGRERLNNENLDELTDALNRVLNEGAEVYFDGCKTAPWAKEISKRVPDNPVAGNANDVWGTPRTGPLIGNGPIWKDKKTYNNGRE